MVTYDPESFTTIFPDEDPARIFTTWHDDIHAILERVRNMD